MPYKANITPRLREILEKGENGEFFDMILKDGRRVTCKLDCLTYTNKSDDDDTDIMVASVDYRGGGGELFAEEDIKEVL